jgi:cytochrome b561
MNIAKTTQISKTTTRYSTPAIGLHWLMLILLVAVYACMEFSGNFPKGSDTRTLLRTWHYMLGLSVFVLVWIRLAVKLSRHAPPIEPALPAWQMRLAHLVEATLYVLMMACRLQDGFCSAPEASRFHFSGCNCPP